MPNCKYPVFTGMVFLISMLSISAFAQQKKYKKKELYFSWGYNKEWYTKSTVKIDQPSLGNHYSFISIKGHDHPGWDDGIFNKALSIPQYNYRLGLFINQQKGLAVEINFDHTKFIFTDQSARIKGNLDKKGIDSTVSFSKANGFYYYLNNGANFLLFNLVKRWHWVNNKRQSISVDLLGKAGLGPVIPHVENSFFGHKNEPHFQLGGWNVGAEAALKTTFFHYIFIEYSNKVDYARYSNLRIYEGTAKHAFGTYEMVLSLGCNLPLGGK